MSSVTLLIILIHATLKGFQQLIFLWNQGLIKERDPTPTPMST